MYSLNKVKRTLEYDKRKTNKLALSLEELQEDSSDDYYLPYYTKAFVQAC